MIPSTIGLIEVSRIERAERHREAERNRLAILARRTHRN